MNGLPMSFGSIHSGNHNDQFELVPQVNDILKRLNKQGIDVKNSILNMDKGFDNQRIRKFCFSRGIKPNVKENARNRKKTKRGRKRFFDEKVYQLRFVIERTFAWMDAFRTLLVRFDVTTRNWKSWHYIAAALLYLKV